MRDQPTLTTITHRERLAVTAQAFPMVPRLEQPPHNPRGTLTPGSPTEVRLLHPTSPGLQRLATRALLQIVIQAQTWAEPAHTVPPAELALDLDRLAQGDLALNLVVALWPAPVVLGHLAVAVLVLGQDLAVQVELAVAEVVWRALRTRRRPLRDRRPLVVGKVASLVTPARF